MRPIALLRRRVKLSTCFFPLWLLLGTAITIITTIIVVAVIKINETPSHPLNRSRESFQSKKDSQFTDGCVVPDVQAPRANATLMMLARNNEIEDVVQSMKALERHFNQWYQYPWTFLNDEPFDEQFKKTVTSMTNAKVNFGVIGPELWDFPETVAKSWDFKEGISQQGDHGIMYGAMESYHKMCRFFSGGFYKHELIRQYEWYWRVEPEVQFFCDITYDPFIMMKKNGKKYGFNIILKELEETVPNLFRITKAWMKKHDITPKTSWELFVDDYMKGWKTKNVTRFNELYKNIKHESSLRSRITELLKVNAVQKKLKKLRSPVYTDDFFSENEINEVVSYAIDRGRLPTLQGEQVNDESYNLLHFWSNFEIARVDLWDNPKYESYFQYLEQHKGFFKERWGDAPVHSIAVGLLLDLEELHYFRDVGYQHSTIAHCPLNHPSSNTVPYLESENYKIEDAKFNKYWSYFDTASDIGGAAVGCRCRCPRGHKEIEDSGEDFYFLWRILTHDAYVSDDYTINVERIEKEVKTQLKRDRLI